MQMMSQKIEKSFVNLVTNFIFLEVYVRGVVDKKSVVHKEIYLYILEFPELSIHLGGTNVL